MKVKKILSIVIVIALVIGFVPAFSASANADDYASFSFNYAGRTYTVPFGSNGSGDGVSWSCDQDGNAVIELTKVGTNTFSFTNGNAVLTGAELIGGGAGGGGGNTGGDTGKEYYRSGSGGGGGEIKTLSETALSQIGKSFSVTIGEGGKGGIPESSDTNTHPNYTTVAFQCLNHSGFKYAPGEAGGDTYIVDDNLKFLASGGASDGGAEGIHYIENKLFYSDGNSGSHQTATRAASGGSGSLSPRFVEPPSRTGGNFSSGSFTCEICGRSGQFSSRTYTYTYTQTVDPWGSTWDSWKTKGGEAFDGAGAGGTASNQHDSSYDDKKPCSNSLDDNNGADATSYGAGGGGGALASGLYGIWAYNHYSETGSTDAYLFAGHGGNGYQGKATLYVHVEITPPDDEGRAGGGGGFWGGKSSNSIEDGAIAGGGAGYIGSKASGTTHPGIDATNPAIPDGSKDGYIRITFVS